MEGNRHERVALLITSYIIGFITAFIAYGLTGTNQQMLKIVEVSQPTATAQTAGVQNATGSQVDVYADEEGLHLASLTSDAVLLSAAIDMSVDSEYVGIDGAHYTIPFSSVSPDRKHVYFCEQPTPDSTTCKPFIYSLEEQIVYPVLQNGERAQFEIASHTAEWGSDNELVY